MTVPAEPRGRSVWAWAPLLALAAIVVAGAVVLLLRGGDRTYVTNDVAGRAAPATVMERLGGGAPVSAAKLEGRVYVINVFASWCVPCRAEHRQLMALADAGVPIFGVAYRDTPENAARFLVELGDPFVAVGLDPEGAFALDLGISGVPETFVVGPDGSLRFAYRQPIDPAALDEVILPAVRAAEGG